MNNIKLKGINPCTGCSVCSASCPKNAIRIEITSEGYYEPVIDDHLCVNCGICRVYCYKYDEETAKLVTENIKTYSAINLDDEELFQSSSGGVAGILARECINQGYKVIGVAYDYDKDIAVTQIASTSAETEEFKGSKYFQSYTEKAFKDALRDETDQRYAVFGTPCQIYAINRYTTSKNKKDKFLFIDIFCHGCPSFNLWKKYLEFIKLKTKQARFDKIEFRSKVNGWHEWSYSFTYGNIQYNMQKYDDCFNTIFLDKNAHCRACYDCKMRSTVEYTDIRLGDFWGRQYDTNTKGVSAVVTYTKRGEELFNSIKDRLVHKEHTFLEVIKAQSYGKLHYINEKNRNYTLSLLASDKLLIDIIKEYKKIYSFKIKIKKLGKSIVKMLPTPIYKNLRKVIHYI